MGSNGTNIRLFTHYLNGYIGTAIRSIGAVLALCSFYIFTRRHMRSAASTYLASLSISDSLSLLLGLTDSINSLIHPTKQNDIYYSSRIHPHIFPYIFPCITWFQFTSVWITIAYAVDRWFAIKWPMLHHTYSSKRACYVVSIIFCFGFIYSIPRFFEFKTSEEKYDISDLENKTESFISVLLKNRFSENVAYQYSVNLALYSLFQSILPLLMLSYFNIELIRSINASSNFLQRSGSLYGGRTCSGEKNSLRYRDGVVTRSVICLIVLFIVCQVPASILHYIFVVYSQRAWLYICYDISNFLIFLNSAVNFFIFLCFNRKFRRELARLCLHSRNEYPHKRTTSNQSLKRSSSHLRAKQNQNNNSPLVNYFDQKKPINNGSRSHLRKTVSDSKYGPNLMSYYPDYDYKHRKSLMNKKTYSSSNGKQGDVYARGYSERYSFGLNTNVDYKDNKREPNYIKYRSDRIQRKSTRQLSTSTITTTISNLTCSVNNRSSDSSASNAKILLNYEKQMKCLYRK